MRLSRFIPRFTLRRLMVTVTIIGIVLGISLERHKRFRKIAAYHQAEFEKQSRRMLWVSGPIQPYQRLQGRQLLWHEIMFITYERAARYPWLLVGPNPLEPQF